MKLFRSLIAVTLIFAFLNAIGGKVIHEIFEHEHVEHTCDTKNLTHFHNFEFTHADFICDFNFSTSFLINHNFQTKSLVRFFEKFLKVKYSWLSKNIYLDNLLLRGPPSIK
jgi:hypothetical protein